MRPWARPLALACALHACGGETAVDAGAQPPRRDASVTSVCPERSGTFADCTRASGVAVEPVTWMAPVEPVNGAAITDCDDDGLPDAFVFNYAGPARFFRNGGGFRFEDRTAASGLALGPLSGAAFGDLDHDGRADLVVTAGIDAALAFKRGAMSAEAPVRVFQGAGACRFREVTGEWGFAPVRVTRFSLVAGVDLPDIDLDGRLDVLVRTNVDPDASPVLYLSRPDGRWEDASRAVFGELRGGQWATLFVDLDDDGLEDVFLIFDGSLGRPARFLRRAAPSWPVRYVEDPIDPVIFGDRAELYTLMGGVAGDGDGDGAPEVFLTDVGPQHLFRRSPAGRWEDVARRAGVHASSPPDGGQTVGFGASMFDYDNDGRSDLGFSSSVDRGNRSPPYAFLFRNRGDGTYENTTSLLGQERPYSEQSFNTSDLDRDGRVDVWLGGAAQPPRLLRNTVRAGNSVAVRLRGTLSNTEGAGARVRVTAGGRTHTQYVHPWGSPFGSSEPRVVFGIGSAARIDHVEVRWPSGYVQRAPGIAAGSETTVTEPELVTVHPASVTTGGTFAVTVRPRTIDGAFAGRGRNVRVTTSPGRALDASDMGDGSYVARFTADAPGVVAVRVTIDGVALHGGPKVMVR